MPAESCIEGLTALLSEETAALQRLDFDAAISLYSEKKRLTGILRSSAEIGRGSVLDLRAADRRLRQAVADNEAALTRALAVQRSLFALVAEAAKQSIPVRSYGRGGSARAAAASSTLGLLARV